jgi:hypothetical protein
MPHYLLSVYQPDGPPPPPEVLEPIGREVDRYHDDLKAAGAWVFGGGLHLVESSTVVRGGGTLVTDGPYLEGKEHLGGFTIIDVPDLDAALGWAKRANGITGLPIEVRPFRWDG